MQTLGAYYSSEFFYLYIYWVVLIKWLYPSVTTTTGKCKEQVEVLYTGSLDDWRNKSGTILLSETHTVGNHTYHSTGRITPVSCQKELSLQLNLTNVTCVQNENITITAVINKYSIGASLKVTLFNTEYEYSFSLKGKMESTVMISYPWYIFSCRQQLWIQYQHYWLSRWWCNHICWSPHMRWVERQSLPWVLCCADGW